MLKKLTILLFTLFLIAFNANAGSDGELALEKNKSETQNTKDCFEKLNRATFAFNQGLDKALIKPIAEGYRKLPDNVQKGTSNAVRNLSTLITISFVSALLPTSFIPAPSHLMLEPPNFLPQPILSALISMNFLTVSILPVEIT